MITIRLSRVGRKKHAHYKVVLTESSFPVKGKFIEEMGSYDPHQKKLNLDQERIKHWLGKGAYCSDTVHNLLVKNKIIEAKKRPVPMKKKKKEETKEEKKA